MTTKQRIRRVFQLMLEPKDATWAIRKRMPNIIHKGQRALSSRVVIRGKPCIKKMFHYSDVGVQCYKRELLAHELFKGRSWMAPIIKKGRRWLAVTYYPEETRLDKAALEMDESLRFNLARQAVQIMFEIFLEGYAHCDFHAGNIYWVDNELIVRDFETMQQYTEGQRPAFPLCYDITGKVLDSPFLTGSMCYATENDPEQKSLEHVLGIPVETVLEQLSKELKQELVVANKKFQTRHIHHTYRAGRIYGSFSLPHLEVSKNEAQRDCSRRLENFCLHGDALRTKTVLDLGSNAGEMLFEAQKLGPGECLGIKYDTNNVTLATKIAGYNGLNNVHFLQADIDKLTVQKVGGPYDVVFFLGVEAHVRRKRRLYYFLGEVTKNVLYFEGNSTTDIAEVQNLLLKSGFKHVEFLGLSDDYCLPDNNCRPLITARK